MKKYLFILSFMLLVLFSEQECKGPDGDSKPTPFRKENTVMNINYTYDIDSEGIIYSTILFLSITLPCLYLIGRKTDM